jgi:hypothetical protein
MTRTTLIVLCFSLLVSACASRLTPPPSCDGGDRRPMNAGKWTGEMKSSFGCND